MTNETSHQKKNERVGICPAPGKKKTGKRGLQTGKERKGRACKGMSKNSLVVLISESSTFALEQGGTKTGTLEKHGAFLPGAEEEKGGELLRNYSPSLNTQTFVGYHTLPTWPNLSGPSPQLREVDSE